MRFSRGRSGQGGGLGLWIGPLLVGLASCSGRPLFGDGGGTGDESTDTGDGSTGSDDASTAGEGEPPPPDGPVAREVDVLFVVDDTASMGEEQAALAGAVPAFVERLQASGADLRFGVTTTSFGHPFCTGEERGRLQLSSCRARIDEFIYETTSSHVDVSEVACESMCALEELEASQPWIEETDGVTNLENAVPLADALQCALPQGINGCGFEAPLESLLSAIGRSASESDPQYGFLRPDAVLAIVIVTDEVDCSHRLSAIFDDNRVFWTDPEANPTSAICWNAGVSCSGGPGRYDDCVPENYGQDGGAGEPDETSVLYPMSRYVESIRRIGEAKRARNPSQSVLVHVIAGVPPGYFRGEAEIVYSDSQSDPRFQEDYGIGPGCQSASGQAIPPVRLRAFAEAFEVEGYRGLSSVCNEDFTEPLVALADQIVARLPDPG